MDLIQASFVLFLSYYFTLKLTKYFKVDARIITLVFIFKTIISIAYLPVAKNLDNDAYGYFNTALVTYIADIKYFTGSGLIFSITKFFRQYFHLNIFSMTFLFSFIGNIGTLALASNIKTFTRNIRGPIKFLSGLVIFFPTLNLWISAIGKDPITFACINLTIYSLIDLKSRLRILMISSFLFALVRPYIGIILFFSLTISFISKAYLSNLKKIFLGIFSIASLITFNLWNADRFLGLNIFDLDFDAFSKGVEYFSNVMADGNFAINLTQMPFPLKIFSFMFRPIFFDARGLDLYSLLMSFENLILFIFFLYLVVKSFKNLKAKTFNLTPLSIFLPIYLTISWIMYSLMVGNLGTANRYKLMLVPALVSLSLILKANSNSLPNKEYLK